MGSIGDTMSGTPIPAVGESGTGYATKIVNFLSEVKTRLEARLPVSSIAVALLDMANNAFQNVQYLGLYDQVSQPSTPTGSIQRYQGNLWYVSASGAFALTNGASLNASSVKGIGGDYGSPNPALVSFVDADKEYYFYDDQPGGAWASTWQRNVDIAGGNTSTQRLRLKWVAGTSHDLSFPTALPGSQVGVQADNTGALFYSNTFNTLTASTDYKHSFNFTLQIPTSAADPGGNNRITSTGDGPYGILLSGGTGSTGGSAYPVGLKVGDKITGWTLYMKKVTSNTSTVGAVLYSYTPSTNSITEQSKQLNSGNATGFGTMGQTGLSLTIAAGTVWAIGVQMQAGAGTTDEAYHIEVTYQRP